MSIKASKCKHEEQDKLHGKGMRVHTESSKYGEKCTVCGPKPACEARLDSHARLHDAKIHGGR